MWFLFNLRNSTDLLHLKFMDIQILESFLYLALTSFVFGWLILLHINQLTSLMMKYYEKLKQITQEI